MQLLTPNPTTPPIAAMIVHSRLTHDSQNAIITMWRKCDVEQTSIEIRKSQNKQHICQIIIFHLLPS